MKKFDVNFLEPSQQQLKSLFEYYQTGRYVAAEKLSLSITQEFPEHQFAWKILAAVLRQTGRIRESLIVSQKSVQLEPLDCKNHNNLGVILQELRKLDEAEACFRKAIALKPDYTEAHNNLGITLNELGRLEEVEECFRKAIELKPDYTEAHNNLGNTLKELERLEDAEASYRKTITLKSDFAEAHYNLGITLKILGKLDEAEACFRKAIDLKPDYTEAHNNLGGMLQERGRLEDAEASYRKTITLKSDFAEAHYNLANVLKILGKLDEAEACFRKAIELKPDYTEAHNNLGITLKILGRLEEAEESYRQAITLKSDYLDAHNNLGIIYYIKGDLIAAFNIYKKAIDIQFDFAKAWYNVFFPLQASKLKNSSTKNRLSFLDQQVNSKFIQIAKFILSYRLNLGNSSTDKSLKEALKILSSNDNTFIKNAKVSSNELIKRTLPKKITAMMHFGRSGTGLLHSLIDGHPQISTLPSIYFSEFFDHSIWEKIIANGWEEMADRFVLTYEVLFDASSPVPIATKSNQSIYNIGQKEGMINVGLERNEVLSVDKKVFVNELKQLMNCYEELDALTFFKLVHSAYEIAMKNFNEKNHIFYHIHNPDTYAQLNYLRLAPDTNWVIMVREPLLSCESWVTKNFYDNDYINISSKIFTMLFEVDQAIYKNDKSIGVRLEDLKEYPKKTIPTLCAWLGIKENDSLYEMTAQGKKWWGDPTSPDYTKDQQMSPFGKASINRKIGSVFSKNDQFILSTLFYPFSVRFGYIAENLKKFKTDLQTIRPMLDQMFDFEKKIVQDTKVNTENFIKSGPYLLLRSGMIERWNTLNKFHTYHNMLTPMKIN